MNSSLISFKGMWILIILSRTCLGNILFNLYLFTVLLFLMKYLTVDVYVICNLKSWKILSISDDSSIHILCLKLIISPLPRIQHRSFLRKYHDQVYIYSWSFGIFLCVKKIYLVEVFCWDYSRPNKQGQIGFFNQVLPTKLHWRLEFSNPQIPSHFDWQILSHDIGGVKNGECHTLNFLRRSWC